MKKNMKKNIQRKIEIKNELEHISNKSLIIFSVALVFEIILLFLYTAFKGVGTYIPKLQAFITGVSVFALAAFVVLMVVYNSFKNKKRTTVKAKSFKNWSFVALAISVCSFFIYPIDIITGIFNTIGFANKGGVIAMKFAKVMGPTAILAIIIGILVYVIGMFVYFNILSNKIKNNK